MSEHEPHADGELFRGAWILTAVVLLGLSSMRAVGVYKMYLTATVRPADDVPTTGGTP